MDKSTVATRISSATNRKSLSNNQDSNSAITIPRKKISAVDAPRRLFHWALSAYAASYVNSPDFPLKPTPEKGTALTTMHGEFRGVPLLYTWIHPVSALALNEKEVHGGDLLLALDIKEGARAIRLETLARYPDIRLYSPAELEELRNQYKDVDLILHSFGPKENPLFQEWVILNPKVVERVTADPTELMSIVRKGVEELRDPKHTYTQDELFSFVTKIENGATGKLYYADMDFRNALADFIEKNYLSNESKLKAQVEPLLSRKYVRTRQCVELFKN